MKKSVNRCPDCGSIAHRLTGTTLTYIHNKPVQYVEEYFQCLKCLCAYVTMDMNEHNLRNARKAYNKEYNNGI